MEESLCKTAPITTPWFLVSTNVSEPKYLLGRIKYIERDKVYVSKDPRKVQYFILIRHKSNTIPLAQSPARQSRELFQHLLVSLTVGIVTDRAIVILVRL
jgi:hypothetical protein